jgi:predicted phosphodiesterase
MRLGLLSDVHANLQALEAVLRRLDETAVDRCVCLGDVVGYGGDPQACLELVVQRADICLMGNHDLAVLEPAVRLGFNPLARAAIEAHARWLDADGLHALQTFAMAETLEADGGVFLIHGTPGETEPFTYLVGPAAAGRALGAIDERFAAVGHTHVPALYALAPGEARAVELTWRATAGGGPPGERTLPDGARAVLNPGSVGQPRDGDPRASFAVLDTRRGAVRQHRVDYDLAGAQAAIRRRGLPEALAARLAVGR